MWDRKTGFEVKRCDKESYIVYWRDLECNIRVLWMYCKYIIEKYEDMQGTEIPGLKTPGLDPWLDWSSGISFPG